MSAPSITTTLWRCDYAGNRVEDISDIVVQGSATMNPENDQTWSLDATVTWDGYRDRLTPYLDWVAPEMTVTWPDGTDWQGQLGLYFVIESPVTHRETSGRVKLRAMDPLWLVARQGFTNRLEIRSGTNKDSTMRKILDGAVLTDDPRGRRRFAIPAFPSVNRYQFKRDTEYPRTENRLDVCNEIGQGLGLYNMWTTPMGIMVTKRMGEARLKARTPVKTYSAHVPESIVLDDRQLPAFGLGSEFVDAIETSPFDDSLLNEILIVNDDPSLPRINVRGRVKNRKNPRSVFRKHGRRKSKKIHNPVIDEDATAAEVALGLLEELSTKNRTIRLTAIPDPRIDFARETIDCYIWNARGDEVAYGQYAVHSVDYGFTPSSGMMSINAGRIDEVEGAEEDEDD